MSAQDILITGVGVVSPIGIGKDAFWQSLIEGKSGVAPVEYLVPTDFPVKIGGEIKDFDPKQYVKPRKSLKVMCREVQVGFSAAALAMEDAGLAKGDVAPDRFGVIYGSEMLYTDLSQLTDLFRFCIHDGEFDFDKLGPGQSQMYPLWMLMFLPNMTACHVGISYDSRGPNNSIVSGDASSLLAVWEAASVMRRGLADMMIVGGAGSRLNVTPMTFRGSYGVSRRGGDPTKVSRPFDADRSGMVNGEGGAAFTLETREHAEGRGATGVRLRGCGVAFETLDHVTTKQAIRNSVEIALRSSEMDASEIGHVNAHGLSQIEHDKLEAQAIRDCLGETPVTAPKSYFGNLGAGSGAVEMAVSVLALQHGQVPPTLNYQTPDPDCPIRVIAGDPLTGARPAALVMSQSIGGQTAALVLDAD